MQRSSEVLGRRSSRLGARFAPVVRLVRLITVVCVVGSALWLVADRVTNRTWPSTEKAQSADSSAIGRRTRSLLEAEGVRVQGDVARALDALVNEWRERPDLQALFVTEAALPDVQGLLSWVAATTDASAFDLIPFRAGLDELGYRMAILPPNGDIVPVLAWTLRNRRHPVQEATASLLRVAEAWRARPDIRERFTVDGRVRVRALLFWAANVTPDDESFVTFAPVAMQLAFLAAEYDGPAQ